MCVDKFSLFAICLAGGVVCVFPASGADTPADFFEKTIQPILKENCFKCHSHEADKIKGGLVLDSHDALLKGGETGPAVVPGKPEESLLIKAVRYTDPD